MLSFFRKLRIPVPQIQYHRSIRILNVVPVGFLESAHSCACARLLPISTFTVIPGVFFFNIFFVSTVGSKSAIQQKRSLMVETDVDFIAGSDGKCQLTSHVDTISAGTESLATGTMFSVTAKEDIEILAFEFSHFTTDSDLEADIYTREGNDYLSVREKPDQWILITDSDTTSVKSPDEDGDNISIVPRAAMKTSVPLTVNAGESRSFYFTLKSQHLRLQQVIYEITGDEYFSDPMIQTNVGIGIRLGNFGSQIDENRAFQGRIHYRSVQDCGDYVTSTQLQAPFVIDSTSAPLDPETIFQSSIQGFMNNELTLSRWMANQNLELTSVKVSTKESKADCSEYGLVNSCILYENVLSFQHFQSLTSKEIHLELLQGLERRNNTITANANDVEMVYIGDQVLRRYYNFLILGVPSYTILNRLQRDYIGDVTYDFLDKFSAVEPYEVEILGQQFNRRTMENQLRGDRHLQVYSLKVDSYIYGIGRDANRFFDEIEDTFQSNQDEYVLQLQTAHTRPSLINGNGEDFGSIFNDILRISVSSNETVIEQTDDIPSDNSVWVIICSCIFATSLLFLAYRLYFDFLSVKRDQKIKKGERLSQRVERKKSGLDDSMRPPNPFSNWRKPETRTKPKPTHASRLSSISEQKAVQVTEKSASLKDINGKKSSNVKRDIKGSSSGSRDKLTSSKTGPRGSIGDRLVSPTANGSRTSNGPRVITSNQLMNPKVRASTSPRQATPAKRLPEKAKSFSKPKPNQTNSRARSKSPSKRRQQSDQFSSPEAARRMLKSDGPSSSRQPRARSRSRPRSKNSSELKNPSKPRSVSKTKRRSTAGQQNGATTSSRPSRQRRSTTARPRPRSSSRPKRNAP